MRSGCPLNYGLEIFGDKWSLLIIRDMMFFGKRYYREFLSSEEKISTNILADRLGLLEKEGLITKSKDPHHKQKVKYSLTQKSVDLLPIIAEIGLWSDQYAESLTEGKEVVLGKIRGSARSNVKQFQDELLKEHGLH